MTLPRRKPFPPLYWLVVLFEFFERGSYYGMMSVLSVYMTEALHYSKQDVGVIKATIQPLLYFLPIISGALADRFGYRRTLMVAFTLLGSGYALTSQATQYHWVFLSLVVMGLGAGTFKPIISGTIARCTDESNSTLGFGIFYWSINLGAFLFPLILVPYLKHNFGWSWVILASAIGTGAMLVPTLLGFREPPAPPANAAERKPSLLQTLANAFEIVFSLPVLLFNAMQRKAWGLLLVVVLGVLCFGYGGWRFARPVEVTHVVPAKAPRERGGSTSLVVAVDSTQATAVVLSQACPRCYRLSLRQAELDPSMRSALGERLRGVPALAALPMTQLEGLVAQTRERPFFLLYLGLLFALCFSILLLAPRFAAAQRGGRVVLLLATVGLAEAVLWGLYLAQALSLFAAILCGVIALAPSSLFIIDSRELTRFRDHFRFLLMIFLYSGFWVLYFQMFDSVLWYVKAYVDASSLNQAVNQLLRALGFAGAQWQFDVEHVTVVNAGTIILLQLLISHVVKHTRALPTMIVGIGLATCGMGVLAISTNIWVFLVGITVFSLGEMTAHPKFISYVGQTAPKARVAMYMGYLFLYGVIGSSIGSLVGANLYVKFVDELDQPRTLWIIFTGIGVITMLSLLVYNAWVSKPRASSAE